MIDTLWYKKYEPKTLYEFYNSIKDDKNNFELVNYLSKLLSSDILDEYLINTLFIDISSTCKTLLIKLLYNHFQSKLNNINIKFLKSLSNIEYFDEIQNLYFIDNIEYLPNEINYSEFNKLFENENSALISTTSTPSKLNKNIYYKFPRKIKVLTYSADTIHKIITNILYKEEIKYDENLLYKFIQKYNYLPLKELITIIQFIVDKDKKELNFKELSKYISFNNERKLVSLIVKFFDELTKITDKKEAVSLLSKGALLNHETLSKIYSQIINIIQNDTLINYDFIFSELLNKVSFLPFYKVIHAYYETLHKKEYKHYHIVSMIYEVMIQWTKLLG